MTDTSKRPDGDASAAAAHGRGAGSEESAASHAESAEGGSAPGQGVAARDEGPVRDGSADPARGAGPEGRPLEHHCDRIKELTCVIEGAEAERDLAMYRAWQSGMAPEQVARLALEKPDMVRHTVTLLDREEDIDEWAEGPTWIQFYRKTW